MSLSGMSYNIGKRTKPLLSLDSFQSEDTYILPQRELFAKYMAISAYYGQFSLDIADKILGQSFLSYFEKQIAFLKEHELVSIDIQHITITQKGFYDYGAVFSLFYP